MLEKTYMFWEKVCVVCVNEQKVFVASLSSRKQGLGAPTHTIKDFALISSCIIPYRF